MLLKKEQYLSHLNDKNLVAYFFDQSVLYRAMMTIMMTMMTSTQRQQRRVTTTMSIDNLYFTITGSIKKGDNLTK